MANSKFLFSPSPRSRDTGRPMTRCGVQWHAPYAPTELEQFDGTWRLAGCPACLWEAVNNSPVGSKEYREGHAEFEAEALNRRLIATGITPRFRGCTFDTFSTDGELAGPKSSALAACREYAEAFEDHVKIGRGLLLLGGVGTGKTHLACAIAQHAVRTFEAWAVVTSAAEICRVMRGSFGKGATYTEADVLEELAGPDLLVIDEIGVQSASDFSPGVLSDVIDRRYQHLRPTILVSNRTALELSRFIGDRAVDRMRQGGGRVVGFHWASARGDQ
ncbi:AAA family ATPase [Pseudomonas sp. ALS1131]|nr:AAA family ATPase [Pseudomonas sp. ALS1131]